MASNLYEYYKSQGQSLPSVSERQSVAEQAGITGYTGSAEQNSTLLGYLTSLPNQGGSNVITSDNLKQEKPVTLKQTVDTEPAGLNGTVTALLNSTKEGIKRDEAEYERQTKELGEKIKASGDTGAFEEQVIKDQGVDRAKKVRDNLLSQIEQEQLATADKIEEVRKTFQGTTAGLNAEIAKIERDSANKVARLGIGLSSASRDYETASNIATRLINANTNKLKADIESRQFVLQQLGTKLATQQSNAFQLQLKQIDKEDQYLKDAIKVATDGAKDGTIDGSVAFDAVQDLTSGKISISEYYNRLGVTNNDFGNINGYDITTYATDPQHELKVQTIYESIPDFSDEKEADRAVKALSPNSPITGTMIMNASQQFKVDPKLMISIMMQDSALGTTGMGARNKNPGNIGQFDDLSSPVDGYKTWQEGVDAVAKWLSNHRSKGIYRGEFQSTLEIVTSATNEPDKTKTKNLQSMKQDVANGDYASLYKKIENTVSKVLTGENKTQFDAKRIAVPAIQQLRDALVAYDKAGGKTGLLKGKAEDIANKLGAVADPKYKAQATDLRIALQRYRQEMSGAAFSEQEAKDYESVNPSGRNNLDLNLAIIEGMLSNFDRQVKTTVETYAGDGARYIREYAEMGTSPQNQKKQQVPFSTPSGNSFIILD